MKAITREFLTTLFIALAVITSAHAQPGVKVTYYHSDALGNPVAATNEQGDVIWRKTFQPYGKELDTGAGLVKRQAVSYTGHRYDDDLGLIYMGARYYDPDIGRFMSVDPVRFQEGNVQSFNQYAYANNSPYVYVDPNGEFGLAVVLVALGAASYVFFTGNNAIEAYNANSSVTDTGVSREGALAAARSATIDTGIAVATAGVLTGVGIAAKPYLSKAVTSGTTTVGRWMSEVEHTAMLRTGRVQESFSGTTHVANPAQAEAFLNQAASGSRYIEFDVPTSSLKQTSEGWAKIIGPNSIEGRLAAKKGLDVPQMPEAANIVHKADKLN